MKKIIILVFMFIGLLQGFLLPVFAQEKAGPKVLELNIEIDPSDYNALISSDQKKEYGVSVCTDQTEYESAEINIRGNSSRQLGLAMPTKRIPFELSFSEVRDFCGFENKSVKFINSISPYRLLAEYLALDLFSYAGIPTPVHSFAFIRFNQVDFGLYIAVEDVNKPFLSKWYPAPLHSAYKGTNNEEKKEQYINTEWFGHVFEKVTGGSVIFSDLIDALDRGEGYEQYVNVDEWLRFFACISVLGGDGSIFTEQNNFVLYDYNGKYELIPWDLSEAFSGRETPNGIDKYYLGDNLEEPNPLFDLLMSNRTYKDRYHTYIRELTEGFLSPAALQERYDAILDAIAPYLPRDHSMLLNSEDALSELRSDSSTSSLNMRYILNAFYLNLTAQLEGREDSFAVNEALADFYENTDSFEYILSESKKMSPLLDSTLPKQIVEQGKKNADAQGGRDRWIFVVVCCAAVCFFVLFLNRQKIDFKTFFKRHGFVWKLLLFLLPYEWVFARLLQTMTVSDFSYAYHALDYHIGFCTKVLPGAIVNFLFRKISYFNVSVYETVLLVLFFIALSFLLEKFYLRFPGSERPYALFLIILFVTGPCSFGIFVRELGMLDAYWLYCTTIIYFLLSNKKLWPLIILFGAMMILVYYSAIICFAPFVVIILLYKTVMEPDKKNKKSLLVLAAVFSVVTIGFTLYFFKFELRNLRLTSEEFVEYMHSKGTDYLASFLGIFYGIKPEGMQYEGIVLYSKDTGIWELIRQRVLSHEVLFAASPRYKHMEVVAAALLILPVFLKMESFFIRKIRTTNLKLTKFVFFCMAALFFLTNGVSFFLSTDTMKWLALGFMLTFSCLLTVLYYEPAELSQSIIPRIRRYPPSVLVCYCIMYAVCVVHPYS